jgi:hypothetical protein
MFFKNTTSGIPTGPDLGTVTVTGILGTNSSYTYGVIIFPTPIPVIKNTKYALVVRLASGSGVNVNYSTAVGYPNGNRFTSTNSGGSWTSQSTQDIGFIVFETQTEAGKVSNRSIYHRW